ncbi:Kinesin-like protein KIF26A [Trichinella nelsoni]|uniref:Kinesin-like protein KIF26A n=1 Tax=Trichinella nelsoni TaxID=6336 RepID=A0A0V0RYH7_9BILA|nr:Kinesin-like protein KIF26A [Trichinella nelsoni]
MEFVLPKFYSNVDYYQSEEDCEDMNGRRLSVMTSRIGRPSDGPLQVQPSLLIPNPLLWSCTSRTTMPWPNIAYSAHHYWSFRPDCRNHVDNFCKALPVKEAPLPLPPQHSLAPTLMTNLADLIVTALNNKPVSKATHYVNNSKCLTLNASQKSKHNRNSNWIKMCSTCIELSEDEFVVFRAPWPASYDFVNPANRLPFALHESLAIFSPSKLPCPSSSSSSSLPLTSRNKQSSHGRYGRSVSKRATDGSSQKTTTFGSNRNSRFNFGRLLRNSPPPVPPALLRLLGPAAVRKDSSNKSEICSNVLFEVIQTVIAGEDSCILSFGYTGEGCCNSTFIGEDHDVHQVGVIPSAISWLYRLIGEQKQRTGARFSVRVSAVEISGPNEEVRDLLTNKGAIVMDSALTAAHLQNASELRAPSLEKAGHYLDTALSLRKFNTEEERRNSHLIFTLHVYQYRVNQDGKGGVSGGRSRLHLIDLGQGEKCTKPNRTSLTLPAIGNVLLTLLQGQKHLPSKDSNLTKIFKETIGSSQCKFVSILACVSPDSCRYMETMNTIQIISRLHRLKRTKKTPFGVGLNSSSGGDSSCEERQRRVIRRSISDPDCTTSSSEQSCDTVIFLGTPGVPFVAEPSAASTAHSHSSSTRIPKPSSNSTSTTAPKRPAHFLNNLICAGPASTMTRIKQSKRERVREWIIRQETERLVNVGSGGGGGGSGAQPLITADEGLLSRSNVEEWNVQLTRSSLYGSPEARYLEDIVEVEEDSSSEQYSSNVHVPVEHVGDHCQKTKTLLHGITESISAAFSDSAGRLRILSTDDVDTRCSDSISLCTASALADPVDEDVPSLSSDEDLELAMQASLSLSSVRSLDILQKLKAERAQQVLLLNTPTQQPKPIAVGAGSFSIGQQQQRLDPEGKERFACFEESSSMSTTTAEKSHMPAPIPVSQSGLLDEVEKRPSVVPTTFDVGCCRGIGGDNRMPPPTSGSYRQAIDLFEPVVCSGKGSKSQQLKFSQSISTRLKNCNSNAGGESKLPKLNLAAVGKAIKEKKSDSCHQVRVKSPLHLLLANARVPKFTARGSHSPSQRTSSGYESGGHDSTVGLIVSPCPKQLTQPCRASLVVARSTSSGRGSDNSSTPTSDSFIRPPRDVIGRGFKSAPQSPGSPSNKGIFGLPSSLLRPKYFLSSRSSSLTREEMEKSKAKIDQLKAKQEALKVELRKAKERLGVPESKWCYDSKLLFTNAHASRIYAYFCMMIPMLGDGAIAQAVLSRQQAGNFVTVNVAYALALAFAIYVSGGVSGGHVNPAVTLALCSIGACSWRMLPAYWFGQYLGAFIGSSIVLVLGTAILLMVIVAVTDERNMEVPKAIAPLLIGLAIFSVASGFGYNCGGAINPARDFSPRLLTSLTGWGSETFSVRNYWFWVPIIGPHIGGLIGAALYKLFVGIHWPPVHEITMISSQISRSFSSFSLDDSGKLANASDLSVTGKNFIRRTSSIQLY